MSTKSEVTKKAQGLGMAPVAAPAGAPKATADTTALVGHREFVRAVEGTLIKRGCRRRELPEHVAEVQTRTLEAARRGRMPGDLRDWKALGATIAKRYVRGEHRKKTERARYDGGFCEEPDECGPLPRRELWDPVDRGRYLAVLKERFDEGRMPEMGGEILWGTADDAPQWEIAEETGLTERQVEYRLKAMRRTFRERLDDLGLGYDGASEEAGWRQGTLATNAVVVERGAFLDD